MNRRERRKQEKIGQYGRQNGSLGVRSNHDEVEGKAIKVALTLQQAGRLAEAEMAWEALRNKIPDHEGVNLNLATVMWRQGPLALRLLKSFSQFPDVFFIVCNVESQLNRFLMRD